MPLKVGGKANFSPSQKLEIANKYISGMCNTKSLGREYNLTHRTISRYIRECGFKIRNNSHCQQKYSVNENYFEKINTEEKAYTLGFLYADGCVSRDGRMIISLEEKDLEILEKIKFNLGFNGPISYIKPKKVWNKYFGRFICVSGQYRLSIRNKKLAQDLINLGCIPAKSLVLKFPTQKQVNNHLKRHFIRGYFDGDGSLSKKKKGIQASITSTEEFLTEIKTILLRKGIKSGIYHPKRLIKRKNNITSVLAATSSKDANKLLDWIYGYSKIFLKRKYNKYLSLGDKYVLRK